MEKFSQPVLKVLQKLFSNFLFILIVLTCLLSSDANAQSRNFGIVYSENIRGGALLFGNTLMNAVKNDGSVDLTAMNGNSVNGFSTTSNGNFNTTNMQYVDIDGNTGDGAGTKNSSSSDLILPAGTNTIKTARLYWGGRVTTADFDMTLAANQTIKVRKGTSGPYTQIGAAQFEKTIQNPGLPTEIIFYQAFVDITQLVQQEGAGTYTVADGTFSKGLGGDFGNYGGWCIMVVYENPTLDFNSIRVYDGYQNVYIGGGQVARTVTLTGLNVPSGALALNDAKIGIMGWEGDAQFNGDYFRINNRTISNAVNSVDNTWNGTITNDGVHVTTKNPSYTDQMGIDIDQFSVGTGYGILPNASSVTIEYATNQDQYFAGVVTFVIKMKEPIIKLSKSVTDANNNQTAEIGEILTFKLKGKNIGAGNANAVLLSDSLPSTMTFVANSLKVNYGPGFLAPELKTDITSDDIAEYVNATKTITFRMGNGANATNGGILAFQDSFEIEFKVTVNTPVNGVLPPIINSARMFATSDALINYVDDATVSIQPPPAPLPVVLSSFAANLQTGKKVKVTWSTSMEINSSSFEIERSIDGIKFNTIASKMAAGNSSITQLYSITDDVNAITAPILYYRLKQIDLDGKFNFSKVVSVKLKKTIGNFTVSPNPFNNNLNINIEWNKNETTTVKVYNVLGAEIVSKNVNMINGYNYITIDELSKVLPGNYIIQFISNNEKFIKQIVKQK